ncbi:hypothetical protein SAMN06264364_1305 [Quadrisphaera granulorum]|uniref:Phage resistance protein n=1 Tax=Quadrisphaera granulorum TaxID=317664 RepID=A0A315ZS98_9ACTN|nr:phage resistance protein [Quadrisphaera granulorum]PWJ48441.1 hypothetical protein BXY45_1305 [Quadrisphaera granulorum]SZE98400.1 hypothetical protein SAMN06264364_1305 [Quadrisphaera granulorum]
MLLKDVLEIPERSLAEDYVLRLTDNVGGGSADAAASAASRRAIEEYVVTEPLVASFDRALGIVADALTTGTSRAAFLTGSFGSGKSHFMAVLHALLRHDATARDKRELQPVVAKHDAALREAKLLPLAFHFLAAPSVEHAIFAGYERQMSQLHPEAPLAPLHESQQILVDAERQRQLLGDERFFAALNGSGAGSFGPAGASAGAAGGVWGALLQTQAWTAGSYQAARSASPQAPERQQLVTDLVKVFFSSYTRQAEWVDLESGLDAIARHAKSLGYDGVVLFLDELVLWLTNAVRDPVFFRREVQKITKLVESSTGTRAVPLVSFVARQVDLRKWFTDSGVTGAEQEALDRAFRHQEGRFATIELGDDNLPYVARQRVLRRRGPEGERVLDDAFAALERRPAVWSVLLDGVNTDDRHRGADEAAFRLTYPFSPALVSTLRSLASVMQRERTALKVMQKMLVDRREILTVDEVIPVGDIFDDVVTGSEALDSSVAAKFAAAGALYADKLQPLLLRRYGLTPHDLAEPAALPGGYLTDDRLVKTLLLAAVAPNVPALKELTASRLASLNHGSITTMLPGGEVGVVLTKVREWARDVPQITVTGDGRNPVIAVRLSDVDSESIVQRAAGEDNEGRRRELLRELVREALGLAESVPDMYGAIRQTHVWRGSQREVDVVFGNVRDTDWLTRDHFTAREGTWRLVIDHPFDDAGHSAAEDLSRVERLRDEGLDTNTLVWLPRFLTDDRMRELRRLVILEWLLSGNGERFTAHADHLSEADRLTAKTHLETERAARRADLQGVVQVAYGAAAPNATAVIDDAGHTQVFVSLSASFRPQPPVGADLRAAFTALLDQAWSHTYPKHPLFQPADRPVTVAELVAVYEHVERAVADPDGRVPLTGKIAETRRVADALGVGRAAETHFLFGDEYLRPWAAEITRAATRAGVSDTDPVTVAQLRNWIADVEPAWGLRPEVADLVIMAWAALRQRAWSNHGGPVVPRPGALQPTYELRTQAMPSDADWAVATHRAAVLFGVVAPPRLTASRLNAWAEQVHLALSEMPRIFGLIPAVEHAYTALGLDTSDEAQGDAGPAPKRLATARRSLALVERLTRAATPVRLVEVLAQVDSAADDTAAARSMSTASSVTAALSSWTWSRLRPLREGAAGDGSRAREAQRILDDLRKAMASDEFSLPVAPQLGQASDQIFAWLERGQEPRDLRPPVPVGPTGPTPRPRPGQTSGSVRVPRGSTPREISNALAEVLAGSADGDLVIDWRLEP